MARFASCVASATGAFAVLAIGAEAWAEEYFCRFGENTRRVELRVADPQERLPCEVLYWRDGESRDEPEVLWRAQTEAGFCESKTQQLIRDLESGGWSCRETTGARAAEAGPQAPAPDARASMSNVRPPAIETPAQADDLQRLVQAAATGDVLVVTGDTVNVRFGPGTDSRIKMQVRRNQQVIELERQGEWVRAEIAGTGGEEGWIHASLLEPQSGAAPRAAAQPQPEPAPGAAEAGAEEPAPAPERAPEAALTTPEPAEPSPPPEPAAGPVPAVPGLERFRESVDYLNSRAQQVAGVDLFTEVEARSEEMVQVTATDAWSTIPPAGQRSYLNTLVERWAAAKGGGVASVQIVDPSGQVVMEKSGP